MKLEIMSGQQNIRLNDHFTKLCDDNGIYVGSILQENFMIYPEYCVKHPKTLYEEVRKRVREHIEQDKDLFILTYSDHVFNAMRVEIRKAKFQGAKIHNILNDGSNVIAEIDEDGHLTTWVDEIFDTWDNALTELLT